MNEDVRQVSVESAKRLSRTERSRHALRALHFLYGTGAAPSKPAASS